MSDTPDLFAALVAAQSELGPVPFDSRNPYYGSDYASLGALIDTARPVLLKHGLCVTQAVIGNQDEVSVVTTLIHKSGQSQEVGKVTWKLGSQDEETGKDGKPRKVNRLQKFGQAVTYLRRYTYAPPLGLYGEVDDDAEGTPPERHVVAPKPSPKPIATGEPTPAFRLRALNRLQAAPGQPNRHLVAHFFQVKKWITVDQSPEDWPLNHVPRTAEELTALSEEIGRFEMQQRQPQETT